MSVTLQNVVDSVRDKLRTITPTIRSVPDGPIENPSVFPFGTAFMRRVNYTQFSQSLRHGTHTIAVQVHVARKDLPRDIEKSVPYGEAVPIAIYNDLTLNHVISTVTEIRGAFRAMEWGDQETLGWDFEIDFTMVNQGVA